MLQEAIDGGQRDSVATKRLAEVSAILACQHHMRTQLSLPARSVHTQGIVKVGPAVLAMLDHPEAPWTVTGLAKRAGMSRGSFAATFKESLGESRSEEHTSELQSLMRISYAVFCLNKKKNTRNNST